MMMYSILAFMVSEIYNSLKPPEITVSPTYPIYRVRLEPKVTRSLTWRNTLGVHLGRVDSLLTFQCQVSLHMPLSSYNRSMSNSFTSSTNIGQSVSIAASHGVAPDVASARRQRSTGGGAVRGGEWRPVGRRPAGRSVGRCGGYRLAMGADQFIGKRITTTAPFCTGLLALASPERCYPSDPSYPGHSCRLSPLNPVPVPATSRPY